jgi:hypothetical protein
MPWHNEAVLMLTIAELEFIKEALLLVDEKGVTTRSTISNRRSVAKLQISQFV